MTYWGLALIVAFAAFAVLNAIAAAAATWLWRTFGQRAERLRPGVRARALLAVRLLPATACLLAVAGLVLPAFHLFEPRGHDESIGLSLVALAAAGAALVVGALARARRAALDTRRFVQASSGGARPLRLGGQPVPASVVDSRFPLVAIVGVRRPRLLVADRVLAACTPGELRAIVAHEVGHLQSRDNLKRLAMRCAPDVLSLTAAGAAIERAWMDAAEEAADEHAARALDGGAVDLAAALVKVARMAPLGPALPLPAAALHRGNSVERRVRRLLEVPAPPGVSADWRRRAIRGVVATAGLVALAGALDTGLLARVQATVELVVAHLP